MNASGCYAIVNPYLMKPMNVACFHKTFYKHLQDTCRVSYKMLVDNMEERFYL